MSSNRSTAERSQAALRLLLEDLHRAGVDDWLLPDPPATRRRTMLDSNKEDTMARPNAARSNAPSEPLADADAARSSSPDKAAALAQLAEQVRACRRCVELSEHRTQTVFGVGNPDAELCFLGEAPGADEDRQGEPFVGRAGQLLTRIIEACRMTRDEVYILNVLKCRPPGNRNPAPLEIEHCFPFLQRQLDIIQPDFICCLGAVAARALLDTTASISSLRGKLHRFGESRVLVTYHPAYLLRNPSAKRLVWDDMKMLMAAMGRPVE